MNINYSNFILEGCRYLYKIGEIARSKILPMKC